jgi:hypothetical protein
MASVPESLKAAVFFLAALGAGCVTTGSTPTVSDAPPAGIPCQVVATWQPNVMYTPDPARGGISAPGLAGRLYLFGPEIDFPMGSDGSAVVDLYDMTHDPSAPVMLERWNIDKETLKRLAKKDAIGWGYTLFLPWGSYRPDVSRVLLKVCYEPQKGTPLYAESSPVTLTNAGAAGPTGMPVAHLTAPPGAATPQAGAAPAWSPGTVAAQAGAPPARSPGAVTPQAGAPQAWSPGAATPQAGAPLTAPPAFASAPPAFAPAPASAPLTAPPAFAPPPGGLQQAAHQ